MTGRPWSRSWVALVREARSALHRAQGRPCWAAAAEDGTGRIHTGVSVSIEDVPASSLCAEQVAAAGVRVDGDGVLKRIAVIAPAQAGAGPPCGRCLQVLHEFGPKAEIRWGTARTEVGRAKVSRLLPRAFGDYRRAARGGRSS